jgi:putative hemolysin
MTYLELIGCLLFISLSAYLSASEIALFSLSKFQLRFLKENFRPAHRKIKALLADPGGLLTTILVGTEILNIALSTLITDIVSRKNFYDLNTTTHIPLWIFNTVLGILFTTPIVLIFCEITPKVIAIRLNQVISLLTANFLMVIYNLFKPIRFLIKKFTYWILKLLTSTYKKMPMPDTASGVDQQETGSILKESEFLMMLEEGHKEGAIQENEFELIKNVFELDNTEVVEVATPLSQVLSIPVETTVADALLLMRSQRYSRIPITRKNKNEVVGILYSKDLLRSKLQPTQASTTVGELMRKPYFVSPNMKLNGLFRKFKQQKTHMAIVKSAEGKIFGVVTMSDILDLLFEDFNSTSFLKEQL